MTTKPSFLSNGLQAAIDARTGRTLLEDFTFANNSASITSFNNSLYSRYQLEFHKVLPVNDRESIYMRTSIDGGVSYEAGSSDYSGGLFGTYGNAVSGGNFQSSSYIQINRRGIDNLVGLGGVSCTVHIDGAADATIETSFWMPDITYIENTGSPSVWVGNFRRLSTGIVDAITVGGLANHMASGRLRLYGLV